MLWKTGKGQCCGWYLERPYHCERRLLDAGLFYCLSERDDLQFFLVAVVPYKVRMIAFATMAIAHGDLMQKITGFCMGGRDCRLG